MNAIPSVLTLLGYLVAIATLTAETTARSTVLFRTSFVDVQRSSVKIFAIEFVDCPIPFGIVAHLHESKASGLTRIPVGDNVDTLNCSIGFKHGPYPVFGGSEAEVSYKNIFHLNLLSGICRTMNRGRIEQERLGPNVGRCQNNKMSNYPRMVALTGRISKHSGKRRSKRRSDMGVLR